MATQLGNNVLRTSTQYEISQYLRNVTSTSSVESISQHLLLAIEQGSIDPTVFSVYLGVAKSPIAIQQALKQSISVQIRRAGIKRLQKELRSPQWRKTWVGLGNVRGLLALMSDFSVFEVRFLCKMLFRFAKGTEVIEKREKVTELLKSLQPWLFPDAAHPNPDRRPLAKYYLNLVPGTSPEFVEAMLLNKLRLVLPQASRHLLMQYQYNVLRELCLQTIFGDAFDGREWLADLLQRFPSATGKEPRFSASMQFSMDVLRRLVKQDRSFFPDSQFIPHLVEPLLRRAKKRRVDWTYMQQIVDKAVAYLETHPDAAKLLSFNHGGFVHLVCQFWSHEPAVFEESLSVLLRLAHNKRAAYSPDVKGYENLFKGVKRSHRYALLRLCFLAAGKIGEGGDLNVDENLKNMTVTMLPVMFDQLDSNRALESFTRLRRARGDENLLGCGSYGSIMNTNPTPNGSGGDPNLYQVVLTYRDGGDGEALEMGKKFVEERKEKAVTSSDQTQRAFYAQSALNYAIASGSLKLYRETLIWTRRFVRDPHTVPALYQYHTNEAKALLSAIPRTIPKYLDVQALRQRIIEANETLWVLFETACSASREPSFALHHWNGTLSLIFETVEARVNRSTSLKVLNLSDDDVYNIIWDDTLHLLIKVEKETLNSGHERLDNNTMNGPLGFQYTRVEVKNVPPSTFRFFDNLAKARDQIWRNYRPTVFPAAATLPEPYPCGLPIQHLTGPFATRPSSPEILTPYIAARANAAVFLDPEKAFVPFPEDGDTEAAIGQFIDDFEVALHILIPQSLPQEEKKKRAKLVWAHVGGPLSQTRMDPNEAVRYWELRNMDDDFKALWPHEDPPKFENYPIIPNVDEQSEVVEWNPLPPQQEKIKARPLEITYIDLSKDIGVRQQNNPSVHARLLRYNPVVPEKSFHQEHIWSHRTSSKLRELREGQVASALLYIDTKDHATSRILSSPFPSVNDLRYPSIYLDDQFLARSDLNVDSALSMIERHIYSVPPTLLAQLTQNTLDALDDVGPIQHTSIDLENLAFRLVDLLTKSDRPELASEFAIRTIIQLPDASSWHRRLLSRTFLRRLPASQSRACIEAFANAIITKLQEQEEARKTKTAEASAETTTQGTENVASKPYIKITTVKYLAQLLNSADFVSDEFTIDTLRGIAQNASHIDIQVNVVESMLSMLKTCLPEDDSENVDRSLPRKILSALETTIPLAGSLDERKPLTDEGWAEYERQNELPEVNHDSRRPSPMLCALMGFSAAVNNDFTWHNELIHRIVLPAISTLQDNTTRWLQLFLRRFPDANIELAKLPPVPQKQHVIEYLLESGTQYLPSLILDQHVQYMLFNISPPPEISAFNKIISETPEYRSRADCRYWLSLFNNGPGVLSSSLKLPWFLGKDFKPSQVEDGITVEQIRRLLLTQFQALVTADDYDFYYLGNLTRQLEPPFNDYYLNDDDRKAWLENAKPVVEAMIHYVEQFRTREWQRDPERRPQVLPDTFEMRLWLLKYPGLPIPGEQEEKCKEFASQILALTDRISGSPYHEKFAEIKSALSRVTGKDRPIVACYLGDISKTRLSWLTMQDQLRIELAEHLLRDADDPNAKEIFERTKSMVESWKRSENEDVRRRGFGLARVGLFSFSSMFD